MRNIRTRSYLSTKCINVPDYHDSEIIILEALYVYMSDRGSRTRGRGLARVRSLPPPARPRAGGRGRGQAGAAQATHN